MAFHPDVFVSAASPELDGFRDVVKATLRELGAKPVEHTDRSVTYGPLDGVLKVAIGRCDAVIHLVGFSFGTEPAERTHGASRRSFPHYEYDVARSLQRRVFSFVVKPGTPTAGQERGDDEARMLQLDHRRFVERGEHWSFGSGEELAGLIRALHSRIMVRRRYAHLPIPVRSRHLFGRERTIATVREALDAAPVVVLEPPERFAAGSLAAGKSTVAIEVAWRAYEAGRFDFVLWLPASTGSELESEMALLTRMDALSLVKDEVGGDAMRLQTLRAWLGSEENAGRILVILDGVDTEAAWLAVVAKLPWLERAKVIITTRMSIGIPGATHLSIGAISADAAVALLAGQIFGGEPNPAVEGSLERVATALGHQPLALQIAGRYMATTRQTPDQFLASLPSAMPNAVASAARTNRSLSGLGPVVRAAVARLDPLARGLLQMLVCLAPHPSAIPQSIFASRGDVAQTRAAVTQLEKAGLIVAAEEGQSLLVPQMVHEVVREEMTTEQRLEAFDHARSLIEAALQRVERSPAAVVVRARLVPHCRALLSLLRGHALEKKAGHLARAVAIGLREAGRLSEAEQFQRRALLIAERAFNPGHPELVTDLRLLGAILHEQRRFDAAIHMHGRAIEILERLPASRSGELVIELFSLAGCLRGEHRLEEAEPVLRRALEVEEQCSGRNHPRTAIAAHQLATLLEILHRNQEAIPFYRRALEIDEHLPLCPQARIASRMHHLAGALAIAGDQTEAIHLHQRALSIDEQIYGPEDEELVAPLKQLAALMEKAGRKSEAVVLLRRALGIEEKCGSTEQIEMATTLTSLAGLMDSSDRGEEAAVHSRRALDLLVGKPKWHPLVRSLLAECRARLETRAG